MTLTPAWAASPVVSLLEVRRLVLAGGEDSIGVQQHRVDAMREALIEALANVESCRAEMDEIDRVLGLLSSGSASEEAESA